VALDGLTLRGLITELNQVLAGGRLEKVYQLDEGDLLLNLYAGGQQRQLYLSCHPARARVCLTTEKWTAPDTPPAFCMLLRKRLQGGRLEEVTQEGFDRVARLRFSARDEMGHPTEYTLVAEVMGRHSNLILLDAGDEIVDAIKRIPASINRHREILPRRPYKLPPPQEKLDPLAVASKQLASALADAFEQGAADPARNWRPILETIDGIGPGLARELLNRALIRLEREPAGPADERQTADRDANTHQALAEATAREAQAAFRAVAEGQSKPVSYHSPDGALEDFSCLVLSLREEDPHLKRRDYNTINEMIDSVFLGKQVGTGREDLRNNLRRAVVGEIKKAGQRLTGLERRLKEAEQAEELRRKGELIKTNLFRIEEGAAKAEVIDYYHPEQPAVEIELDPTKTPIENAQRLFKRYEKLKRTVKAVHRLLPGIEQELKYLRSVDAALDGAETTAEVEEIRQELVQEGYIKDKKQRRRGKDRHQPPSRQRQAQGKPRRFVTSDGLTVFVGSNNRQNDYLTTKQAGPDDLWLHVKDFPGSHAILETAGQQPPETSIVEAAMLAAYYSKARDSANVPVDYTLVRHVRKPKGAKPGMVVYDHHSTVFVTPEDETIGELRRDC